MEDPRSEHPFRLIFQVTKNMALASEQNQDLYDQVDAYDWDHDVEFQGGLKAILGSASSSEQVQHLTTRAKCFYYSR